MTEADGKKKGGVKDYSLLDKKKKKGAKEYSLFTQGIAAVWIGGWSALKFAKIIASGNFASLEMTEIIFSAFSIAACFTPVYFSIFMDKIKSIKFGDSAGGKNEGV